jgi:hypothetical protein
VIAGKSLLAFRREAGEEEELSSKCFAFVQTYDEKPKRRLFEVLRSQGLSMIQQVKFPSDGGEDVRQVQMYLNPEAEHLLEVSSDHAPDGAAPDGQRGTKRSAKARSNTSCGRRWSNSWRASSGICGTAILFKA